MQPKPLLSSIQLLLSLTVLLGACSNATINESTENQEVVEKQADNKQLLFVGTYTRKEGHVDGKAKGIYVYEMDPESGKLSYVSTSPSIVNPSYITVHPSGQWLYAVSETGGPEEKAYGEVTAFRINQENKSLEALNTVSSEGKWPCYISIAPSGEYALVANYGGGFALLPIEEDGKLQKSPSVVRYGGQGPHPRQDAPHAHMITPGPAEKLVYAVDLGVDKVFSYTIDAAQDQLQPTGHSANIKAGSGPRHLSFHPTKDWAYVVNELSGTIDAFKVDAGKGTFEHFQTISTLAANAGAEAASADIHIHPTGKYLYASNRGSHNNIAMFAINENSGELSLLGHQSSQGKTPRSFVIAPGGKFLLVANQDSGNVATFRIDENTGMLTDTGINTEIPTPVSLKFMK